MNSFSNIAKSLEGRVFNLNGQSFNNLALDVFSFQYLYNDTYNEYCKLLGRKPENINNVEDIPFLPISAFKTHVVKTGTFEPESIYTSSGTSGSKTSMHFVKSNKIYTKSLVKGFEAIYGSVSEYCVLALLPAYLERKGSSLISMVDYFTKKSRHPKSDFYLYNHSDLKTTLNQLALKNEKVLLIGVSFGLLDFAENHQIDKNPELIVMETGGMKGRRKELVRTELHEILSKSFQVENVHSEYGMTELLSQAYAAENGLFQTPNWMKVLIRKQDDPFTYCVNGETGGLNIIDLANLYSCSFIQTDDLGKYHSNERFEILGRFDQSDVRGCNLMVS